MPSNRWIRRVMLAVVWAGAASTWASIAHHLLGLTDAGPALVVIAGIATLVLPTIRERIERQRAHRVPHRSSHLATR